MQCEYPCTLEKGTPWGGDFETSAIPNYETLSLEFIFAQGDSLSIPFEGAAAKPSLTLPNDVVNRETDELQLSVKSLSGEKISKAVDIDNVHKAENFMADRFNSYPEHHYPVVPTGIYLFILLFGVLVIGVLGVWTYYLVKASKTQYKIA